MKTYNKEFRGSTVVLKEGENINSALRRFKKKVQDSRILETLKEKEFFEKPTTARKKAKGAAKARWRKQLGDQQLPPKLF